MSLAAAWKRKAKQQRRMVKFVYQREARRDALYRLAGVGLMDAGMPMGDGDARVTISVPGEDKRKAIAADARRAALSEARAAMEALASKSSFYGETDRWVRLGSVLAAIDALAAEP